MAEDLPAWFEAAVARAGPTADEPRTAARVVAVAAAGFSLLWFLLVAGYALLSTGVVVVVLAVVLYPATVGNAYVVAYLVWGRLIRSRRWSYRRGALAGAAVGVAGYATVGFVWMLLLQALLLVDATLSGVVLFHNDPPSVLEPAQLLVGAGVLSGAGVVLTLGIPLGLAVGAGVWLTYARRRTLHRAGSEAV